MSKVNRLLTIPEPRRVEIVEKPYPRIKVGFALVRALITPVCTEYLDYQEHQFDRGTGPETTGHKGVGEIVQVAEGSGFEVGDRVFVWDGQRCGECWPCRQGLSPAHCVNKGYLSPEGMHAGIEEACESESGGFGFSQYTIAPEDIAVRRAIDHAMDRQEIINVALLGHRHTCPTSWVCTPHAQQISDPELSVTPFDLDEASTILDEAGYVDSDGDGIRETADGQPLEFRLFYNLAVSPETAIANMISEWLSEIGIAVQVEAMEEGTLTSAVRDLRDLDLMLGYWPDEEDAVSVDFYYSCWSTEAGAGAFNDTGYCSQEMDDLIAEGIGATGLEERRQNGLEIGRLLNRDLPFTFLVGEEFIQAYRNDRFRFNETGCTGMAGLWDWYGILHVDPVGE
jgi:hypothetical protein